VSGSAGAARRHPATQRQGWAPTPAASAAPNARHRSRECVLAAMGVRASGRDGCPPMTGRASYVWSRLPSRRRGGPALASGRVAIPKPGFRPVRQLEDSAEGGRMKVALRANTRLSPPVLVAAVPDGPRGRARAIPIEERYDPFQRVLVDALGRARKGGRSNVGGPSDVRAVPEGVERDEPAQLQRPLCRDGGVWRVPPAARRSGGRPAVCQARHISFRS
jgi:hypothetical protein